MTVHPNLMTAWSEITCQRGADHEHVSRLIDVDLARLHGYHDYTPVPARLAREFSMWVWDPNVHPVDGGAYCPAHDAVSETIISHNVWEPRETVLMLTVLDSQPGPVMDIGAQIGWFTLLALSAGCEVDAFDAEADNLDLLVQSAALNGWDTELTAHWGRLDHDTTNLNAEVRPVRFAKIDIEGAEHNAVRILTPWLANGLLDHLMVEVSPTFIPGEHYPDLVERVIGYGYQAFTLPEKQRPPVDLEDVTVMDRFELTAADEGKRREVVRECGQMDVWFKREGASW